MDEHAIEDWLSANQGLAANSWWAATLDYLRSRHVAAYVVGGSVRDALLARASDDLDLAVAGNAMGLARALADKLHGAYVPLDTERDVARVVLRADDRQRHIDLAALRAADIEADLRARDFTVNALALSLDDPSAPLLDPTGGLADLRAGVLRAAGEGAFRDDPLRVLRAVRLRGSLGFSLEPATEALARESCDLLRSVSAERIRDELVLMLGLPHAAAALAQGRDLGIWKVVLPELTLADGLAVLERLEAAVAQEPTVAGAWAAGLEAYRAGLARHWAKELAAGRSRWASFKLAAWLSPLAPDLARRSAMRLKFSAREWRFVENVLEGAGRVRGWHELEETEALAIYRYYRAVDDAGVDGALLALAMAASESQEDAGALCDCVQRLLRAWFEQRTQRVYPPQLVSGSDLMETLELAEGPLLGRLLEAIREAQVQGWVQSRAQALDYAQKWLDAGGVYPKVVS